MTAIKSNELRIAKNYGATKNYGVFYFFMKRLFNLLVMVLMCNNGLRLVSCGVSSVNRAVDTVGNNTVKTVDLSFHGIINFDIFPTCRKNYPLCFHMFRFSQIIKIKFKRSDLSIGGNKK